MAHDACMVYRFKGALRRNCRQKVCETSFSPKWVFRCCRNSSLWFWGLVFWLTHGDLELEARVDFLAVVEHRLIPARFRSEWARLRGKDVASVWAPACQDSSHVGNAGVGVVSLRGAPVSLPTFATAQS